MKTGVGEGPDGQGGDDRLGRVGWKGCVGGGRRGWSGRGPDMVRRERVERRDPFGPCRRESDVGPGEIQFETGPRRLFSGFVHRNRKSPLSRFC